ncbi:NAD(P) transhydrogenase subunit alpha [Rhodococcus sp. KRD162]|uniref:NAD(P) transhydrogenase subunit alpha n=1 Tax=Rhodococcus sp. KRD162 TaxID=2729725 RepID=UPI0019D28363|nr:NAD(P) transhydrogenase subunit alpha [Rhodococcus sp. KRD162]
MAELSFTVGALTECFPGEQRVSVTPKSITRLATHGVKVLVEAGAGAGAFISDDEFAASGAEVCSRQRIIADAAVITCIRPPSPEVLAAMHSGQFLVGMLHTTSDKSLAKTLNTRSIVGIDLALLPRTMSNAQSMDAMTSQDSVAGYKAVIVAAGLFGRYLPMMITAAGTSRPTTLVVLGAGVAGLQAIATARRLGADVTGYDIRPECRSEIESLGARFLELAGDISSTTSDGYARSLTTEEQDAQQKAMDTALDAFDIVITTARVPGHRPPTLVTTAAIDGMRPGSVVLDMAASSLGGNVEGSVPDTTTHTAHGVSIIGAGNLAATVSSAASDAYARNIADVIAHFVRDDQLDIDPDDPIDAAIVVGRGHADRPQKNSAQQTPAMANGIAS